MIDNAFLEEEVPAPEQDIERILNAIPLKAFSKTPEEFKPILDKLEELNSFDLVNLELYIDEIAPSGDENSKSIVVFARVDPFKYATFSDGIFKANSDRVKNHAEKIAAEASSALPGRKVAGVIGYTNLSFNAQAPSIFDRDGNKYTFYSQEKEGYRVKRFYAASSALDGNVLESWVEKVDGKE